jgi:hypothetical protein
MLTVRLTLKEDDELYTQKQVWIKRLLAASASDILMRHASDHSESHDQLDTGCPLYFVYRIERHRQGLLLKCKPAQYLLSIVTVFLNLPLRIYNPDTAVLASGWTLQLVCHTLL